MGFLFYPGVRETGMELMDDPTSEPEALERTLKQLTVVNVVLSRMRSFLRRWVIADMLHDRDREYTILDIGAGACDIPLWLLKETRTRGVRVRVTCVDHDPRVVDYARRVCAGEDDITIIQSSAFDIEGEYDYVICNHVLHHLDDQDIVRYFELTHRICRRRMVCNDLLRSYWSILGFNLFAALFLRNSFARRDGLLSIRKGFRSDELTAIIDGSRWKGIGRVISLFPGRLCVVGQKPAGEG